ncbi:MAG: ARMT1-like domain-containing protein [Clostridia bacterium]|nr:ARMT1-like domain-containing protein [Clostridia bacterium]
MTLDDECRDCLYGSQTKKAEAIDLDAEKLALFKKEARLICDSAPESGCAPLLCRDLNLLHGKIFAKSLDYSKEKKMFNSRLLEMEDALYASIQASEDPLKEALKYAMASNYIDYARIYNLSQGAVDLVIQAARGSHVDAGVYAKLRQDLSTARTLCYLHDNCGEIVLDKILIRILKDQYPALEITSVVRGKPVINDVTEEDARDTGLYEFVKVIGNGTDVPGTPLGEVSKETLDALSRSDVIFSKGLGNLETLYGEGYSAYYCFCCKCNHIAERFSIPLWSAAIVAEQAI